MALCCLCLAVSTAALPTFCPKVAPEHVWARVMLSPLCLRWYQRGSVAAVVPATTVSRAVARVSASAIGRYRFLLLRTLMWLMEFSLAFMRYLCTPTCMIAFAVAVGAEIGRRRWNGPNVVAAVENFIDEHIRRQRYAVHQVLFISWVLTGSWADFYSSLRDVVFRHVSDLSLALLLARGCMALVDRAIAAGSPRAVVKAAYSHLTPLVMSWVRFVTFHCYVACLFMSTTREACLYALGRDVESDSAGTIELLMELVAAPLASACGTLMATALIAELWSAVLCLVLWNEVLRLLDAYAQAHRAREARQQAEEWKWSLLAGEQSVREETLRKSATLMRESATMLRENARAMEDADQARAANFRALRVHAVSMDAVHANHTNGSATTIEMHVAELEGYITQLTELEEHATLRLERPTFRPLHPLVRTLFVALRRLPGTDVAAIEASCQYKILVLVFLVAFPVLAVTSATALKGILISLDTLTGWLLDLLLWALVRFGSVLDPIFEAAADGIRVALRWRALLQRRSVLLLVLPASVWFALKIWLNPGQMRQTWRQVVQVVSGRGHQSRCIMRMVLRRPIPNRPPEPGDTCPICIDTLDTGDLIYCRWGCGRPVHKECMESWRGFRNTTGMTECLTCKAWI